MRHDVRVAPDRRREVAVAGAAEPGVAEVLRRVVGLLERAQDEAAQRGPVAGLARHDARHLRGQVRRLLGGHVLGYRRRRHVEAGELLAQERDGRRVGALVNAVEGRQAVVGQVAGDLLVGQDHELLDQAVRLRLLLMAHTGHVAVGVELEGRLGVADLDGVSPPGERTRDLPCDGEPVRPRSLGAGPPREDLVHLAVGEALVAAHARAVERDSLHRGAVQLQLEGHGELVLAGAQRAGARGEHLRQHRLDRSGDVDAGAPAQRLAVQRAARAHVRGDVRDVDPDPHPAVLATCGDRVVEVLGVVGVDREGGQRRQVDAGVGGERVVRGALRLGRSRARVGAAQAAVEHQALEHVAGHVGTSQPADHPRAALAGADQHEVALTRAAALDRRARAVAEQRLGDQEAAALLEHGDERLVEAPRRTTADCRAHSLWTRASSATGSASSRVVRGLSTAFTCGLMPFVVIVLPPGR